MNAVVTLLPWLSIGAKGETTALTDNQKLNVPYTEINTFLWVCTLLKAFHIVNMKCSDIIYQIVQKPTRIT